jgi:ribosomal RNA assembly protein
MIEILRIPEKRKPVLIGKNGSVKKELEARTKTKITVGEDVQIYGDSLNVIKAKEIVKAIGRGFSPEKAFLLLDEDYQLYIISLERETGNTIKRVMARVIGKKGSARKRIEEQTGAWVSVYGKMVSIIGRAGELDSARHAVESLLSGRSHAYVYSRLRNPR